MLFTNLITVTNIPPAADKTFLVLSNVTEDDMRALTRKLKPRLGDRIRVNAIPGGVRSAFLCSEYEVWTWFSQNAGAPMACVYFSAYNESARDSAVFATLKQRLPKAKGEPANDAV